MSGIGYSQLSENEKKVYRQFEKAFSNYSSTVDVNGIDRKVDVMKVLQVALGDHPQVIYFDKTQLGVTASILGGRQLRFCGLSSTTQIKKMNNELKDALEKVVREIEELNPLTNYDKLLCIYEYLQDHVTYDIKEFESGCSLGRSVNPMSHNAYGVLINKMGVCDGISSAFSLIAQKMGFECSVVSGKASFRTVGFSNHAWNIIKVDNSFYHMDPTWDVNRKEKTEEYSYDYFCLSDDSVSCDHEWDITTTPICSKENLSFYKKNNCFANNLSQLEEIFIKYAKSKQSIVRAKIAEGIAIPEPAEQYLGKKLLKVASSVGRHASITYSWDIRTRCFYAKFRE